MATVKCHLGKRGKPTHEWNDGVKDRIYCMGWVDRRTDDPLPECLSCPDHVSHAQEDLDTFNKEREEATVGIHRCGNSWACCDGECKNCSETEITISNRTAETGTESKYIELESTIALADYTAEKHPYRVPGNPETYRQYNEGWNDACDYIIGQLENAKTTLHIRIGRWIHRNGYVECSECGTVGSPEWKCCPICTARMDWEGSKNGKAD